MRISDWSSDVCSSDLWKPRTELFTLEISNKLEHIMPIIIAILIAFLGFGGVGGCMAIYPTYNVYTSRMAGQAQLAEAEGNRPIAVRAAMANRESANMDADAELTPTNGRTEATRKT